MFTLLAAAVAAVPSGYTEIKAGNGCKIYKGPATAAGIVPVYASCDWPDVAPAKLHARLADWEQHDEIWSTVGSSTTKKTEGSRSLVHQVHTLSSISNREVELWMEKKTVPGGFQYAWKSGPPVTPAKGNVATTSSEGFWQVTDGSQGSHVEYALTYDPGGSVPGFLVRWFQASGTLTSTEELRAAVK